MNKTNWVKYNKGEVNCYSWKLARVQVKITDRHYINNFVDHVIFNNIQLLHDLDKIVLLGEGNPIAIYPKNTDNLNNVISYLGSIKNTDIHTVVISLGENSGIFVNSELIEDVLSELNAQTKIDVRYILNE
jgi:hypothetical protein